MDPLTAIALIGGLGNSLGLFGKQKKTKGVQKQWLENIGYLIQLLGPDLNAAVQAQARGGAMEGQQAADQLRNAYARAGGGGSAVLDLGRALAQGKANVAYGITAPQAKYAGMRDIAGLAGQVAGAGGAQEGSMPQGAQSMQDILGVLGTYLLSRGQGGAKAGGAAGGSTGLRYNPSRAYFGPGINTLPPNLKGVR